MSRIIKDIDHSLKFYPKLKRVQKEGLVSVSGEIPIIHSQMGEIDKYKVVINFPNEFPNCFPKVIETSNKIPRIADRHVNRDNTLCLAVLPEELAICKNGISFKFFLDKVLIPHLARETYREQTGNYPDGEFGHGFEGVWEYYEEILSQKNRVLIISELEQIVDSNWPGRNSECPCGSGIKFKKCHQRIWSKIIRPGREYVLKILTLLKRQLNEQN